MIKISASQIRQNSAILNEALRDEIIVTKREKPFVVIVSYDRYLQMQDELRELRGKVEPQRLRDAWRESARTSGEALEDEDRQLYEALQAEAAERISAAG